MYTSAAVVSGCATAVRSAEVRAPGVPDDDPLAAWCHGSVHLLHALHRALAPAGGSRTAAPAAALVPPVHPRVTAEQARQSADVVPQPGPAVTQHHGQTVAFHDGPQRRAVAGS